jgi:hypothetical protein
MSVALATKAIQTFLTTPTPQVLCIRGKWGVGKTYIWEKIRKQAIVDGAIALPYYSYVSLFGLQTIDEVRQSVFENSVPTTKAEFSADLDNLGNNLKRYSLAAARKISRFSPYARVAYIDKYISNLSGGFRQIISLAVKNTIICFDDFERKKIAAKDLLGLASQFREQKQCKVVIILNEDALTGDEKREFSRYFEKVVEIPIEFSPTPEECAAIALNADDFLNTALTENVVKLGISNIRIISRILNSGKELFAIVSPYNVKIHRQVLHTLTLVMWSKYDDGAVPLDFVRQHGESLDHLFGEDTRSEDEKKWSSQLNDYGFNRCDELDMAIMAGVEKGFFDTAVIVKEAQEEDARHKKSAALDALHQAWRNFADTFDVSDVDRMADRLYNAYLENMQYVTAGNLDEVIVLLKKLGFPEKTPALIDAYIAAHRDDIRTFDPKPHPLQMAVNDEDLQQAIQAEMVAPTSVSVKDALIDLSQQKIRSGIEAVYDLSADDPYALFSSLQGNELNNVVAGSLFFLRVGNASEEQKGLASCATEALIRLGKEHPANAWRIKRFGINIDAIAEPDASPQQS